MHLASKKFTRGNQLQIINKNISKEIMKRARFRNQFLKIELITIKAGTQNKGTIVSHY